MAAPHARATLQTIADRLGVSRSTVSNAYNRPDQLSPVLRERILALARELGYPGPDPAARRLREGHAGAVGLLLTETLSYAFTDAAAVRFLEGLARRCEEEGAALLLLPLPRASLDAGDAVRGAVVDAFCVFSIPDSHPAIEAVLERRLPTVIVDEPRIDGATFVGIDDRHGMRLAGQHVIALGHRRFALLVPTLVPDGREGRVDSGRLQEAAYYIDRERIAGFLDALRAAGLAFEDVPIYECANRQEAGTAAAAALLTVERRPTALLATTDELAFGAMRAARELGLAVPGDVSITGFDDVPEAARTEPALTTVRQPLLEKGAEAGRLLFALMRNEPVSEALLPVELAVRGSTAPPPG